MTEQRIVLGAPAPASSSGCASGACGCGGQAAASDPSGATTPSRTLRVEGMTCAHCVRAVTEELTAIDGVTVSAVELHAGAESLVHITTTGGVDDADLAAAIDEAGYTLTS